MTNKNDGCPKHQLVCSDLNADLTCFAPKSRGPCESNINRFYFNPISGACLPFFYGGCGGNANRFADRQQCQDQCNKYLLEKSATKSTSTLTETVRAAVNSCGNVKCRPGFSCQLMRSRRAEVARCVPHASRAALERCSQPFSAGSCTRRFIRFYYDREHRECRRFEYGGCEGNANNFDTKEDCEQMCDKVLPCPSVRLAPPPPGCRYEETIGADFCTTPVQVCNDGKITPSTGDKCPAPTSPAPRQGCRIENSTDANGCPIRALACFSGACAGNPCTAAHSQCGRCINQLGRAKGYRCERDAACEQKERDILCLSLACDETKECQVRDGFPQCIAVAGPIATTSTSTITTVSQGVEGPTKEGNEERDILCLSLSCDESKECQIKDGFPQCIAVSARGAVSHNVQGSPNDEGDKIAEEKREKAIRINQNVDCDLPPQKGPCSQATQQWYYDPRDHICREFTYGGCEGNANRFPTQQICRHSCISKLIAKGCPLPTKQTERAGCRNELTTGSNGCSVYELSCRGETAATTTTRGEEEACRSHTCTACQRCVPRTDVCVGNDCLPYECTGGCGECEACTSNGKCLSTKVVCSSSWLGFNPCAGQSCPRMPTAVCQPDACNCRKPLWILPNDRVLSFGEC
uniref:BPTI/Kunitz inhibitor domain-containing protein n=1 Tax=Plectus sambesii TaxID=2011161 RepID=A0A914VV22_9BILA